MEFSSRYIYEVLKVANVYRMHASREELDVADIRLAVQCRADVYATSALKSLPPLIDLQ
jgi:histone H3/H4